MQRLKPQLVSFFSSLLSCTVKIGDINKRKCEYSLLIYYLWSVCYCYCFWFAGAALYVSLFRCCTFSLRLVTESLHLIFSFYVSLLTYSLLLVAFCYFWLRLVTKSLNDLGWTFISKYGKFFNLSTLPC